jgi:threonine/homoserine/homoserine lactone efflux protein
MKALTFWEAAAFQYTNPKTGMLAAATAGSFIGNSATIARISTIVAVFSIATVGSLITWA